MFCVLLSVMSCHVFPIGTTFDHNYSGMSCKIQESVFMVLELYMGLGSKVLQGSALHTTCNTCWNGYFFFSFFF